MEFLKLVIPFLSGGLAGAIFNEWLRRRSSRLQSIPLIERVNRLVDPGLDGFILARASKNSPSQIERVENVREYQLTLRNTSTVHLKDVEIQFEFPAEDIEAWAERPVLSKTAPIEIESVVTAPWKHGFRWRIPNLPSTDSMEFTFKAVNPPSDTYEVALYNANQVVIRKSKGEPTSQDPSRPLAIFNKIVIALFAALIGLLAAAVGNLDPFSAYKNSSADITVGGCELRLMSSFEKYEGPFWAGPWRVRFRIFNAGNQKCTVQSEQLDPQGAFTINPGEEVEKQRLAVHRPKMIETEVNVRILGGDPKPATVSIYREP